MDISDSYLNSNPITIVSLIPIKIEETKPGMVPDTFVIPPATDTLPSTLVVTNGKHAVYLGDDQSNWVPELSKDLVESIISDFVSAQPGITFDPVALPGLFSVDGRKSKSDILSLHHDELQEHRQNQNRWYNNLVLIADDDWQDNKRQSHISNLQRIAAKTLGLERPWLVAESVARSKRCPACLELVHPEAAICSKCRTVIDEKKYSKFAKVANG